MTPEFLQTRLRLGLADICLGMAAILSASQSWAAESTIKLVVPFAAGGSIDVMARLLAPRLSKGLQQNVIVENRTGAGGVIGTEQVIRSEPDGRTLLMASTYLATNVLVPHPRFDPLVDLLPVVQINSIEILLMVNDKLEVQSLADLKRLAQSKPGGLNCAAGAGVMTLGCERLAVVLEGKSVSVPYSGLAPAVAALMAGHVDIAFLDRASATTAIDGRRVRVLASAGATVARPPFEQAPLLKNTWPGFSLVGFGGAFAPAGTPGTTIQRLNQEFNTALNDPEVRAAAARSGEHLVGGTPEVLGKTLSAAIDNYSRFNNDAAARATPSR